MDNEEEIWFLLNFSWDFDGCSLSDSEKLLLKAIQESFPNISF